MDNHSQKDADRPSSYGASTSTIAGEFPVPSPTGYEYYLLLGSPHAYEHHMLPLDPLSVKNIKPLEGESLFGLGKPQIQAIQEILQERNSRTVEKGQWVVVCFRCIRTSPEVLGLVIRFYEYGVPFSSERDTCLQYGSQGGVLKEKTTPPVELEDVAQGLESGIGKGSNIEISPDEASENCLSEEISVRLEPNEVSAETENQPEAKEDSPSLCSLLSGGSDSSVTGVPPTAQTDFSGGQSPNLESNSWRNSVQCSVEDLPLANQNDAPVENFAEVIEMTPKINKSSIDDAASQLPEDDAKGEAPNNGIDVLEHTRVEATPDAISAELLARIEPIIGNVSDWKDLARLHMRRKEWVEVERILKHYLNMQLNSAESTNPEKLQTMHDLALAYCKLHRFLEAAFLYARCLEISKSHYGESHEETLVTMRHLANTYTELNLLSEALELSTRCLEATTKLFGEHRQPTFDALHCLAKVHEKRDQLDDAEKIYLTALGGCEILYGKGHVQTHRFINCLLALYRRQNRDEEAATFVVTFPEPKWVFRELAEAVGALRV
ncbi:hypothetical protein RUND412_003494 [Rhizina undulata]